MITVICPVYNEIRFIEAWLANVRRFADRILIMDTGSTDGTYELLVDKNHGDIQIHKWHKSLAGKWYLDYNDYLVRSHLIAAASSADWIVRLDADEFIGQEFINFIRDLPSSMQGRKIARMREQKFWGNLATLRMPSLWPPIYFTCRAGKLQYTLLRNYRGATGGLAPMIYKSDPKIRYHKSAAHPLICDGRHPRITYRDKRVVLDTDIPYYHIHYAFPEKYGEARSDQRGCKFKTVPFVGKLPNEIDLIK